MQAACGEVALAYAEVEAPGAMIRRPAASEEPFDAWFKEKLLELHGHDPRRSLRGSSRFTLKEPTAIPAAFPNTSPTTALNKEPKEDPVHELGRAGE